MKFDFRTAREGDIVRTTGVFTKGAVAWSLANAEFVVQAFEPGDPVSYPHGHTRSFAEVIGRIGPSDLYPSGFVWLQPIAGGPPMSLPGDQVRREPSLPARPRPSPGAPE